MRTPLDVWELIRIECRTEPVCGRCQSVLQRHQPDAQRPERQLGACEGCGVWYLIDDDARVMIALPDLSSFDKGKG